MSKVEKSSSLWMSSSQTVPPEQGDVSRMCVLVAFEYLHGPRSHHYSAWPVISHPPSEKLFPDVQMGPIVFQFVPRISGPVTGHCFKEAVFVFRVCKHEYNSPEPFPCHPLLDSLQCIHISLVLGGPVLVWHHRRWANVRKIM